FGTSPSQTHSLANGPVPDITFSTYDNPPDKGIFLHLDGNAARYTDGELDDHAGRFQLLLTNLAFIDFDASIGGVDILSAAERRLMLESWNATDRALPSGSSTLVALFETQAARTPSATALVFQDVELS